MESDQVDGQHRTKAVRARFSIPLCCWGAGSSIDAEVNINSSETQTDDNTQQEPSKSQDVDKQDANTQREPSKS
jgi:hypothetical protein